MIERQSMRRCRTRVVQSLAVLWLCALPAIHAGAVTESFSYPDGLLEGSGTVGEWAGPWQAGPATDPGLGTTPFKLESGRLKIDYTDTPIFVYNDSDVERSLASPIATPSVYVSFEITPGEMGNVVPTSRDDGYAGLNIAFADNATNIGSKGPMFSVYEYYSDFDKVSYVNFDTSLDGIYDSTTSVVSAWTPGNTYRLVGRLEFDAVGLNERWTVWLDPASEASTPQVTTTRDLGYSSIGMTRMWQYIYNFQNTQDSFMDNLRIGSSWLSVSDPIELLLGDLNGDLCVDDADLQIVLNHFGAGVEPGSLIDGDATGDGLVDAADLDYVLRRFGDVLPAGTQVPEPSSLALLALGGLLVVRGRR